MCQHVCTCSIKYDNTYQFYKRLLGERHHAADQHRNHPEAGRDVQAAHTGRSVHAAEQSALRRVVQSRRGHLSGHLSAEDLDHRLVQHAHAWQKARLDQVDIARHAHARRLTRPGKNFKSIYFAFVWSVNVQLMWLIIVAQL